MKITTKDLKEWGKDGRTIRYRGEHYKLYHNGFTYFLHSVEGLPQIALYKVSRGIWGLETNKK